MNSKDFFIHETAIIDDSVSIGVGTKIWHHAHICSGAIIGDNCILGQNVYIGPNVKIGNNVKIQNNVSVYTGIEIEDDVFLGPSCVFTNDKYPKATGSWKLVPTKLKRGCSVGANSTIICGTTLGENCLVGAGSVVTKDVSPNTVVVGNPAKPLKKKKEKIGVVGCGVVGGAILAALNNSDQFRVIMNDKFKCGPEYRPIEEFNDCDLVFVSVPTPFNQEFGKVDLSAVYEVVKNLNTINYSGILIIKSTVPPGTTKYLQQTYPNMTIIFNPEFLRERTAIADFYNQKNIIFGYDAKLLDNQVSLIEKVFSQIVNDFNPGMVTSTESAIAEMIKYSQNVMFASRIAICNIIYDACQEYDIDYNRVKQLAFYNEPTIGKHVVEVPGPDGYRGFGGTCLPKDLAGFNGFFNNKVLEEILKYNKELGREIK